MQARAAATLDGSPVDVGVPLGAGDEVGGGGCVGSTGCIATLEERCSSFKATQARRRFRFRAADASIRLAANVPGTPTHKVMSQSTFRPALTAKARVGSRLLEDGALLSEKSTGRDCAIVSLINWRLSLPGRAQPNGAASTGAYHSSHGESKTLPRRSDLPSADQAGLIGRHFRGLGGDGGDLAGFASAIYHRGIPYVNAHDSACARG